MNKVGISAWKAIELKKGMKASTQKWQQQSGILLIKCQKAGLRTFGWHHCLSQK